MRSSDRLASTKTAQQVTTLPCVLTLAGKDKETVTTRWIFLTLGPAPHTTMRSTTLTIPAWTSMNVASCTLGV